MNVAKLKWREKVEKNCDILSNLITNIEHKLNDDDLNKLKENEKKKIAKIFKKLKRVVYEDKAEALMIEGYLVEIRGSIWLLGKGDFSRYNTQIVHDAVKQAQSRLKSIIKYVAGEEGSVETTGEEDDCLKVIRHSPEELENMEKVSETYDEVFNVAEEILNSDRPQSLISSFLESFSKMIALGKESNVNVASFKKSSNNFVHACLNQDNLIPSWNEFNTQINKLLFALTSDNKTISLNVNDTVTDHSRALTKIYVDFIKSEAQKCSPFEVFELKKEIGRGQFGRVHIANDIETKISVAVKIIPIKKQNVGEIVNEIKIMKLIKESDSSDNCLLYMGCYKDGNELWLVNEYCNGGSLQRIIDNRRISNGLCLSEQETGAILYQILQGLINIHSKNIIHRDLKSGNILLKRKGVVKIGDFGISLLEESSDIPTYSPTTLIGSSFWMAPEMTEGDYSSKIDIWSLGITTFEMIEGFPPRMDHDPGAILILTKQLPPPTLKNEDLYSPELVTFLSRCLEKNPELRPTAKELFQDPFIQNADPSKVTDLFKTSNVRSSRLNSSPPMMITDTLFDDEQTRFARIELITIKCKKEDIHFSLTVTTTLPDLMQICIKRFSHLYDHNNNANSSQYTLYMQYRDEEDELIRKKLSRRDVPLDRYLTAKENGYNAEFLFVYRRRKTKVISRVNL